MITKKHLTAICIIHPALQKPTKYALEENEISDSVSFGYLLVTYYSLPPAPDSFSTVCSAATLSKAAPVSSALP